MPGFRPLEAGEPEEQPTELPRLHAVEDEGEARPSRSTRE